MYCYSENNGEWKDLNATTLAGAKTAASRKQMFQGSHLWVGFREPSGDVTVVAKKLHRDALDMSSNGKWEAA